METFCGPVMPRSWGDLQVISSFFQFGGFDEVEHPAWASRPVLYVDDHGINGEKPEMTWSNILVGTRLDK
jgi:hypothetical protein